MWVLEGNVTIKSFVFSEHVDKLFVSYLDSRLIYANVFIFNYTVLLHERLPMSEKTWFNVQVLSQIKRGRNK